MNESLLVNDENHQQRHQDDNRWPKSKIMIAFVLSFMVIALGGAVFSKKGQTNSEEKLMILP